MGAKGGGGTCTPAVTVRAMETSTRPWHNAWLSSDALSAWLAASPAYLAKFSAASA